MATPATPATLVLHHPQSIHRVVLTALDRTRRSQLHVRELLPLVFSPVDLLSPRPELSLVQLHRRVDIRKHLPSRQTGIIHPHILKQCRSLCLQRHSQRRRCSLRERVKCRLVLRLGKSARYHMCAICPIVPCLLSLQYCAIARPYRRNQHRIPSSETRMGSSRMLCSDIRILLRRKLALQTRLKL